MTSVFDGLFIFELANNHLGQTNHGAEIIRAMARQTRTHGIRAGIKFQYRHLDSFIHPQARNRTDLPHLGRFLATRLSDEQFLTLIDEVRAQGLIPICTPFDERSVDLLLEHGIEMIKVASCSANDWPLLERVAAAGKPTICSTGGCSLEEIDNLVSFMVHRGVELALMHCVSLYPTPAEEVQLHFMTRLMRRFPFLPVGYSGHEAPDHLDVVQCAVAKGAALLERHVGIPTADVPLNRYSLNPEQVELWIRAALEAHCICGDARQGEKKVSPAERESLRSLARGVYAARAIPAGKGISLEDIFFAMPCNPGQTTTAEYQESMVASRDYAASDAIVERRQPDLVRETRAILHDAKGLLHEANIDLGPEFTIEISHHYGIEQFRQVGALLVTVVNREYCKRLVVMLPGQRHPSHYHRRKEETFHVLAGEIELVLDGQLLHLERGDQTLIQRGAVHSFSSRSGAVFEELSTRHVVGDSYYEDQRIRDVDPMKRKTVLEGW